MKFRFVDRILDWQPKKSIRGLKTVSFEEYNLKAPFGDAPSLPQMLVMESVFQLGNWLVMLSTDFEQMLLIVRANEINFLDSVTPGKTLQMEVQVQRYRDDGILLEANARVDDKIIVTGKGCLGTPVKLRDYCKPDDVRVLFSEIYQPQNQ